MLVPFKRASHLPPLILLGGEANVLPIARSLAADGVKVHLIDGLPPARHSRAIHPIRLARGAGPTEWAEFLLGTASEDLRGAVVLAGSDAGVEFIALRRRELADRYLLDDSNPKAQLCMLDKLCTYETAVAAGIPTPAYWQIDSIEELEAIREDLAYPVIVKPRLSHLFRAEFGYRYFLAHSFDEAQVATRRALNAGIAVILMEMIPGPDSRLCSYYTYLGKEGIPLFDFTKRVVRRYPANMGLATYHITDEIPELKPLATALLRQSGLRGLAAVEFKLDVRDDKFKIIECNARFTAANRLLAVAGLDLGRWVYYRVIGRSYPLPDTYAVGQRLWSPVRDFGAFVQLRRLGQLTTREWIRTVLHRQSLAWFDWRDPLPSVVLHWGQLSRSFGTLARHASGLTRNVVRHRRRDELPLDKE